MELDSSGFVSLFVFSSVILNNRKTPACRGSLTVPWVSWGPSGLMGGGLGIGFKFAPSVSLWCQWPPRANSQKWWRKSKRQPKPSSALGALAASAHSPRFFGQTVTYWAKFRGQDASSTTVGRPWKCMWQTAWCLILSQGWNELGRCS